MHVTLKHQWAIPCNKHTPPLWMTFNECPVGYFETCPGGSRTNFNDQEGKGGGGILSKFDCV